MGTVNKISKMLMNFLIFMLKDVYYIIIISNYLKVFNYQDFLTVANISQLLKNKDLKVFERKFNLEIIKKSR